ncbi:MAG TPA: hypothetical protein VM735_08850 [Candidatus Kapabacteria bacterium]|nr:hypothetical protein [Candidatus Kapabacteria bacterium]
MKKREKILVGIVLGFVAIFVLGFGVKGFFVKPLKDVDKQTTLIREQINKINVERRAYFDAEDSLKKVAQRTFSTDLNQASARSGEMITKQIALAGLNEGDFTRLPVGPRRFKGANEIGWSIQGKGTLDKIINLVFLLQNTPQVHRIESVTLTAYDKPGEIKVRFLYLTLVVDPAPEFDPIELKPKFTLESPERFAYNTVLQRDILRPYIKATHAAAPKSGQPAAPSSAPAGPEALKVVSLSEWEGQPEVHIRDVNRNETLRYRPGDKLKDNSEVVAVDYRALPSPRNPLLLSHSRVILKIGVEFWAVERGQSLSEKRKLQPEEWPAKSTAAAAN